MSTGHGQGRLQHELTAALLGEARGAEALAEQAAAVLGFWPAWLDRLAFIAAADLREPARDRYGTTERVRVITAVVEDFLRAHPEARRDLVDPPPQPEIPDRVPATLRHTWPIARLPTTADLAERLELSDGQLAWLADQRGFERFARAERLRNYRYRWSPRRSGLERLIETPKARLKETQRWILREILDHVPAHDAAHGFTRGRSVHTHAAVHSGRAFVLRLDLRDFFASVSAARVHGIFATIGYPPPLARALTGLSTNRTPSAVLAAMAPTARPGLVASRHLLQRRLAAPHLPQGAPTSPALANLAAFTLDRRLTGLAIAFGLSYTRYADDLTFSGPSPSRQALGALTTTITRIARDEGFAVNPQKTMIRSRAQRQLVTGLVVNAGPHTPRDEYDRLRAQLHRLSLAGAVAQTSSDGHRLRAELHGRVAWIASVTPARGARLGRLLAAIDWIEPAS